MRRRYLAAAAAAVLAACQDRPGPVEPVLAPSLAVAGAESEAVPGRYIVVFRDDVQDAPGLARRLAAAAGGTLRHSYQHAIKGFAADLPEQAVAALQRNPNVAYVEQDQVVHAVTTQTGATWGIDRIDQSSLPLSGTYSYTNTGAGVTAYIIDTGIQLDHNDFGGRAVNGWDFVSNDSDADDCHGHGTHVAGTVGGTTYGVAKGVALVAVRVLNCRGSGTWSGVIAGMDWVAANHVKPAVANMSLGGGASSAVDDAVERSVAAGVTYAVAAGNSSANACNYSPARAPDAITVGATTSSDARSSYSNYGSCLDIFAPGSGITSAWHTSITATNTISGTSMASPHVAGAAALYLQSNPGASPATVTSALTSAATTGVVSNPGSGSPNRLLYTGFLGGGTEDPPTENPPTEDPPGNDAPTARFTYTCSGFTCTFDASTSSDPDGDALTYDWRAGTSTRTGVSASFTFDSRTSNVVELTVTDPSGAHGSTSQSVSCNPKKCQ